MGEVAAVVVVVAAAAVAEETAVAGLLEADVAVIAEGKFTMTLESSAKNFLSFPFPFPADLEAVVVIADVDPEDLHHTDQCPEAEVAPRLLLDEEDLDQGHTRTKTPSAKPNKKRTAYLKSTHLQIFLLLLCRLQHLCIT